MGVGKNGWWGIRLTRSQIIKRVARLADTRDAASVGNPRTIHLFCALSPLWSDLWRGHPSCDPFVHQRARYKDTPVIRGWSIKASSVRALV